MNLKRRRRGKRNNLNIQDHRQSTQEQGNNGSVYLTSTRNLRTCKKLNRTRFFRRNSKFSTIAKTDKVTHKFLKQSTLREDVGKALINCGSSRKKKSRNFNCSVDNEKAHFSSLYNAKNMLPSIYRSIDADTTRNSITVHKHTNRDLYNVRNDHFNTYSLKKKHIKNLKRFISEHTRWKNKINEISSKKKIFKIVKRKLSVASNSSDERRNFTVRMAKTGVLKKSNLLDKIKLNTSVRFRDKDQCKFNKIAYCKDLTNLFLKKSVRTKFIDAATSIQRSWRGRKTRIFFQARHKMQEKAAMVIQNCWKKYWSYKLQIKKWEGKLNLNDKTALNSLNCQTFSQVHILSHFKQLIKRMKQKKANSLILVQKYMRGYVQFKKYEKFLAKGKLKSISKNLSWMKKYEIRKNKKFRVDRLSETFVAKNVVQCPHRNQTSLREFKNKSYKKCYYQLNPRNSVNLMPFDDDLTSIEVPPEPHISSEKLDISFISDSDSDDQPVRGSLSKFSSVPHGHTFMSSHCTNFQEIRNKQNSARRRTKYVERVQLTGGPKNQFSHLLGSSMVIEEIRTSSRND
ncbi:unnamed protein product [Moneuplotes crassus]|uniref:Uncharacterized protein n=1 Tax=Euplotes crassus TaxID=5936 RepID=A0AAD2D6S1_EUPCR|nr:unnamed protein product [Moneuplotes crassus]